jgi:hypothetical protein
MFKVKIMERKQSDDIGCSFKVTILLVF